MKKTFSENIHISEIKALLDSNNNLTFHDIFKILPRTKLASETGLNKMRIKAKADNPALFKIGELIAISSYLQVTPERVFIMAIAKLKTNDIDRIK